MLEVIIRARLLSKITLRDSYDTEVEWVPDYLHREIAALEQALELYGLGQERVARALLREIT